MDAKRIEALQSTARSVRHHILSLSSQGGCFIGASLSCTDLLVYLYFEYLSMDLSSLDDPERDYVLLSKGHDVPAMYGCFVEKAWLAKDRLANHLKSNDSIYWHPNRNIPGVEFHSGSLGQLPSVGAGIAQDCKMKGRHNRVLVIMGDGELNEGSVWETFLVASNLHLNNLCFVIDRNYFQANVATEDLMPLEPLEEKFKAFGIDVLRINGHDFEELDGAFRKLPFSDKRPSAIICDTVRGKGIPSIERRADRWFVNFSETEVEQLRQELAGGQAAQLNSETLTVR